MTTRLVGVLQDVTDERSAQRTLWKSANIDALTGIANRNLFQSELANRFLEAAAGDTPVSLMLMDLDGFKEINDTRGHQAGDEVLRSVAQRLAEKAPDGSTVARLGGDEFAIIVPGLKAVSAQKSLALQLQATLKKPVKALGEEVAVSATMGIANYPRDARTSEGLLRCADIALYNGKSEERGAVGVYTPDVINLFDRRRLAIEKAEKAVLEHRLVPSINRSSDWWMVSCTATRPLREFATRTERSAPREISPRHLRTPAPVGVWETACST